MKKNKTILIYEDLAITDAGAEGMAVGKHDGLTVFVPYAVPGDVVDVQVYKKKKNYAEARIVTIKTPSPLRQQPLCEHFGLCGGCKWQIMPYEKQLFYKQKQAEDAFQHLGKFDFPAFQDIIPSDEQYYYRNKLEFTFSSLRWLENADKSAQEAGAAIDTDALGFHIPGKFDKVLDLEHCYLQAEPSNSIRLAMKRYAKEQGLSFYNIKTHEGLLRNVVVRTSSTGEIMLILIVTEMNAEVENFMRYVAEKFPQVSSLQYVINTKFNDAFTDLEVKFFKGTPFIYENMEDLKFKIGPVSFFQTNTSQACKLYNVAKEFAQIGPDDLVYDLYTGTGTIANFVARQARKVVGIEYVEEAIADARINSELNGIHNTAFYAGDMAKVLTEEFVAANGRPAVVITDPPRAGMHPRVIEVLLNMAPQRIVYVSCNPATQARDLTLLDEKYKVTRVQPVDMFPQTHHVENVALLELRD